MKSLQLALAVIIAHALLHVLCGAQEYVYIKSTSTDAEECSTEQHPCYTLAYYVLNADIYFRSDTTVVLLGGIHTFNINRTIVVKDIKNFVMQGKWQAFNCSGGVYWEWRVRIYQHHRLANK